MSTIIGKPAIVGGGTKLNIDYGSNPPSDTSKLWVPLATKPSSVEAKYVFKYGNEQLEVSDYNYIGSSTNADPNFSFYATVGDYIYVYNYQYSCFNRYNMNTHIWEKITPINTSGSVYHREMGHLVVGNKIYMFGGRYNTTSSYTTAIYVYDTDTNTRTALPASTVGYLFQGVWIKSGDVAYGFGVVYGSANSVVKYDLVNNTTTLVSGEFTFDTSNLITCQTDYYAFDAGNGIYYLLPLNGYNYPLVKVDLENKTISKYASTVTELFPAQIFTPTGSTRTFNTTNFIFNYAGIVQLGSTGYVFGGQATMGGYSRFSPFIWKIDISSSGLNISVLNQYLYSVAPLNNLNLPTAAGCLDNKIHIVQYCSSTDDTSFRNNQTLTLYSPLDQNKLFLQTGFGNNEFNIINSKSAVVQTAIKNAFIGNSENKADETNAFLYDTSASKWKNIKSDSVFTALKGDLITMDLDGNGNKLYRVLKMEGNIATVLAMFNSSTSQVYNATYQPITLGEDLYVQQYKDSDLDTYLNTTYYNTLSSEAKAAIVSTSITQDIWYVDDESNSDYVGTFGNTVPGSSTYGISKYSASVLPVGDRYVFALNVQDIIDYLNDSNVQVDTSGILRNQNIWKMIWNKIETNYYFLWLRSAGISGKEWLVRGSDGCLNIGSATYTYEVRPAFRIDLTKIPFTRV